MFESADPHHIMMARRLYKLGSVQILSHCMHIVHPARVPMRHLCAHYHPEASPPGGVLDPTASGQSGRHSVYLEYSIQAFKRNTIIWGFSRIVVTQIARRFRQSVYQPYSKAKCLTRTFDSVTSIRCGLKHLTEMQGFRQCTRKAVREKVHRVRSSPQKLPTCRHVRISVHLTVLHCGNT